MPNAPWRGKIQRDDKLLLAGLAASGIIPLAMMPLVPSLVATHPELLELLRGSVASVVNMGARARVGETSIVLAVLLGVPSLMMFDWVYWWAGRRWGDGVFAWLLGGNTPRSQKRLARMRRLEARFGPWAVALAYLLPVPTVLIYAAVGDGGMRLRTFLALDLLGTMLWTGLLALAGYLIGRSAVDVADAIARYGLWATVAIAVGVGLWTAVRRRPA